MSDRNQDDKDKKKHLDRSDKRLRQLDQAHFLHPHKNNLAQLARENFERSIKLGISEGLESRFISTVKSGNVEAAKYFMDSGADINAQDEYGMTGLHYAAAMGARPCIRLLVNSGKCDYLIQDNKGRYASELAFEWAKDYAVGLLLSKKQVKQAASQDI